MNKININTNRAPISSKEIAARRDFQQVLQTHQATVSKPFYKTAWFAAGVSTVTLIAALAVWLPMQQTDPEQNLPTAETVPTAVDLPVKEKAFVKPPLRGIDVPFRQFAMDASSSQDLSYANGSSIHIPASAFVDANGKAITGEVTIEYRELHDVVDFFVSGIPMTYDSAGTEYHFESAGMLEIRGIQNGKDVFIAPGKQIDIEMASNYDGSHYNLYKLDTVNRAWAFLGKDEIRKRRPAIAAMGIEERPSKNAVAAIEEDIESRPAMGNNNPQRVGPIQQNGFTLLDARTKQLMVKSKVQPKHGGPINTPCLDIEAIPEKDRSAYFQLEREVEALDEKLCVLDAEKVIIPKVLDPLKTNFSIDFLPEEFPELKGYNSLEFEVTDRNTHFKPGMADQQWEEVRIYRMIQAQTYRVVFSRPKAKGEHIRSRGGRPVSGDEVEELTLEVIPVVPSAEFSAIHNQYRDSLNVYKKKRKQLEHELQIRFRKLLKIHFNIAKLNSRLGRQGTLIQFKTTQDIDSLVESTLLSAEMAVLMKQQLTQTQLLRAFSISNFGIYNCDSPQMLPPPPGIAATYTPESDANYILPLGFEVYLAERGRNALFRQPINSLLRYAKGRKNMLWGVTDDGQLAYCTAEEFTKIPRGAPQHKFGMKLVAAEFKTLEDVKRIFNL